MRLRLPAVAALIFLCSGLTNALDKEGTSITNGLIGEYFSQKNLTSAQFIQIDKSISFEWATGGPLGQNSADNYSVRWKGRITPKASGTHTFRAQNGGGLRVMINDIIIMNSWNREPGDMTGKIDLEKGKSYPILIEYQDISGPSYIKLFWSCGETLKEEPVPASALLPKIPANGLTVTYFEHENFGAQAAYSETDSDFSLPKWKNSSHLSAVWGGRLEPVKSGKYAFTVQSDGDVELKLNNLNILGARTTAQIDGAALYTYTGSVSLLNDRKYTLRLAYSRKGAKPSLKVKWLPPSATAESSIPASSMYPQETITNTERPVMHVDASDRTGALNHFWKKSFGSCHAAIYLRPDMQEQMKTAKQDLGMQYMRFHGILDDQVGIYSIVAGKPVYNWTKCDKIYDFLLSLGIKPFVEFGFMPPAMAAYDKKVFWYAANVAPPADYGKWKELVRACVEHWKERYGLEEIKTWKFEAWNEPNYGAFWGGSKQEYFKLYAATAEGVKSVDPALKVGGPASSGLGEWVADFVAYCATNKVPLDFVSTHGYPWDKGKIYDRDKDMDYPIAKYFYYGIREASNYTKQSGIPALRELNITEWGVNDYDKIQAAPFVCHTVKDAEGYVDTLSFWAISDIFEEMGPVQTKEFPGIFGLFSVHGIKKATYNAFLLLNKMGDTKLNARFTRPDIKELEGWASTNSKDGSVQAMLWNFSTPDAPGSPWKDVTVSFKNLPLKKYKVTAYMVDNDHGNAYKVWEDMGRPEVISYSQAKAINEKAGLAPSGADRPMIETPNGSYGITLDVMPRNSIYFVTLTPVN